MEQEKEGEEEEMGVKRGGADRKKEKARWRWIIGMKGQSKKRRGNNTDENKLVFSWKESIPKVQETLRKVSTY